MATVSFINLDQNLDITDNASAAFASGDLASSTTFSYITTGGDDWDIFGSGFAYSGGLPTGGTITGLQLDLDNDLFGLPEIVVTGLSIAATSLGVGVGTADQQRDAFWAAVLGGADTINFTMVDYSRTFFFAGDGANVSDGALHVGAADNLVDGGAALTDFTAWIAGDYFTIISGGAVGGDDTISVGAFALAGDFISIGTTGVGGDDIIRPLHLADNSSVPFLISAGDAWLSSGTLFGGNDVIDLRLVDMTGVTDVPLLYGDVKAGGLVVIGGNDTIHGSSHADGIYGDAEFVSGYLEGGKDRLFGYGGNDNIFGNSGRDQLYGGDGDDLLDGGLDGDIIDGGAGNDSMIGDTGNDSMLGGDGNDTMIAGSGSDTVDGGTGDDVSDAGAGVDNMKGGNGKDSLFGGTGSDSIDGGIGNDTLSGGDNSDAIFGGAGFDVLTGGNDNDYLDGGADNDQLYGNSGVDTFNFQAGYGTDTIRDFVAGAGLNDFIRLQLGTAFDSFAEVLARATDNGVDTTITLGGGDVIVLKGVLVSQLNADDFTFG